MIMKFLTVSSTYALNLDCGNSRSRIFFGRMFEKTILNNKNIPLSTFSSYCWSRISSQVHSLLRSKLFWIFIHLWFIFGNFWYRFHIENLGNISWHHRFATIEMGFEKKLPQLCMGHITGKKHIPYKRDGCKDTW